MHLVYLVALPFLVKISVFFLLQHFCYDDVCLLASSTATCGDMLQFEGLISLRVDKLNWHGGRWGRSANVSSVRDIRMICFEVVLWVRSPGGTVGEGKDIRHKQRLETGDVRPCRLCSCTMLLVHRPNSPRLESHTFGGWQVLIPALMCSLHFSKQRRPSDYLLMTTFLKPSFLPRRTSE